ncbi:MAG: hypothetical protein RL483_384 [Pseudomonadota bacterium]
MQKPLRPRLAWVGPHDDFPRTQDAWTAQDGADGLLAVGETLSPALLVRAYQRGIFPWSGPGEPILWWTPDPRMVLRVSDFRLHRSIRQAARQCQREGLTLRFNQDFDEIVQACSQPRAGQAGTWITPDIRAAYLELHTQGLAHCLGLYQDQTLLAGLYFVQLGQMVFGESMFTRRTNGSKVCLAALVLGCQARGIALIDCQQQTGHLASLGAQPIHRHEFEQHLQQVIGQPAAGGPEAGLVHSWPREPLNWEPLVHPYG